MSTVYTHNNKFVKAGTKIISPYPVDDGHVDNAVKIGNQIWMTKNVAIDDGDTGIYSSSVSYDDGITYVTEYYYTLSAANRIVANLKGWRIPTANDFTTLLNTASSNLKLCATYGWPQNGTDDYGMGFLPTGSLSTVYYPPRRIDSTYEVFLLASTYNVFKFSYNYGQSGTSNGVAFALRLIAA